MDAIGLLTIVAVIVVTIGDPIFVHIIRRRAPSASLLPGLHRPFGLPYSCRSISVRTGVTSLSANSEPTLNLAVSCF